MLERFYRLELEYDAANPSTRKTRAFDTHPYTHERLLLIEDSLDGSSYKQVDKQRLQTGYREQVWSRLSSE
jgi:hypothetical protein